MIDLWIEAFNLRERAIGMSCKIMGYCDEEGLPGGVTERLHERQKYWNIQKFDGSVSLHNLLVRPADAVKICQLLSEYTISPSR